MDSPLHELKILCPACHRGSLELSSDPVPVCRCAVCAARFPTDQGVIDLVPDFSLRRTPAQALMEWHPLVRIYESRLWRRSPVFALLTHLSFEKEYSLIKDAGRVVGARRVLDLACGSGIYSRRFAREVGPGWVVGLDLSRAMLRYAVKRSRAEGLDNLVLIRGNAMELPFEAGYFDLVNCCGALHLFPDPDRVMAEIHRVLKPGGRFTCGAVRRGEGGFGKARAALQERLSGVKSFTLQSLKTTLEGIGFSEVQGWHDAALWLVVSARKSDAA
ncbi:MAG: methyltransferase domain-containing protein [Nitrospirae bacterium]|nr:methyltransferase domain-containing protein [Nitrospirota bacterium]